MEANITATDTGDSRSIRLTAGGFRLRTRLRSDTDTFGSAKGRAGVTLPSFLPLSQPSLIYVTGGLVYAGLEHPAPVAVTPPGAGPRVRSESIQVGYVIGGGSEHALTSNVSLKIETLWYDLKDEMLRLRRAGDLAGYRIGTDGWISRVRLNLRFQAVSPFRPGGGLRRGRGWRGGSAAAGCDATPLLEAAGGPLDEVATPVDPCRPAFPRAQGNGPGRVSSPARSWHIPSAFRPSRPAPILQDPHD